MSALGYDITGPDGAPVLVLGSSLGTTRAMWEPQVAALAEHFRVVRYDHRGHGGSAVPPGPYSLDDLGSDVLDLLDRLGVRRVHAGGLSLGGMVGMWLAAHAPDRVDRLVLCCTAAHLPPAEAWQDRAEAVKASGTASIADAVLARWFTAGFAAQRPDVVAWARDMLLATPDEGYAGCCAAVGGMDLRPVLHQIMAPTLIIAGADDPATPPALAQEIAAGVAGARMVVVHGAAHLATVEQAADCTAAIIDHLLGKDV